MKEKNTRGRGQHGTVEILDGVSVPERELTFAASRSSGPGGQNVNKVSSRVMLRFDVKGSRHLSCAQKTLVMKRLATRVNKEGVLRVACQRYRSQMANRNGALERFVRLMREALESTPSRKKTRVPRAARMRRLEDKRRRGRLRRERSEKILPDE